MNKEQILEKSRKENKNQDLAELELKHNSERLAGLVAVVICFGFFVIEKGLLDRNSYGYYCIFTMYAAVEFIYKAVKTHKTNYILRAVLWSAATAIAMAVYLMGLSSAAKG